MAHRRGSWPLVLGFVASLVIWTLANGLVLRNRGFDPYPFILLYLAPSCLAAPPGVAHHDAAELRPSSATARSPRATVVSISRLKSRSPCSTKKRGPSASRETTRNESNEKAAELDRLERSFLSEVPAIVQNFRQIR